MEEKLIGFVIEGNPAGITYDLFKFAAAAADGAVEARDLDFQQGKIEVVLQEVKEEGVEQINSTYGRLQDSKVPSLPEGKIN